MNRLQRFTLGVVTYTLTLHVLGASSCGSEGDRTTVQQAPQAHPVYESADLGTLDVLGAAAEARARVTLNADELLLAVVVEGDYVPAVGNASGAVAELAIFDTLGDQDASNDLLAGMNPPASPFSRAPISVDAPGSFSIRTPLGTGARGKLAVLGGTWSCRLRIQTTAWYGTVTGFRLRVVTLKGAEIRPAAESFVRDQ